MWRRIASCGRVLIPVLVGICIGVALSFMILPYIEEIGCELKMPASSIHQTFYSAGHQGVNMNSFRKSEYEPRVIGSKQSESQMVKRPMRYKFAQQEIDMKDAVFIAYLTSTQQIALRSAALNRTLFGDMHEKASATIKFFHTQENTHSQTSHKVPGIVDFHLLQPSALPLLTVKYLANPSRTKYKYYAIVPDTVYIIPHAITQLLELLADDDDMYIGFPKTPHDFECDLTFGFILSQVCNKASI